MSQRISMQTLEAVCTRLNKTLDRPETYCAEGQPFRANVGNFHISGALGGLSLFEVANELGGVHSYAQGLTRREMFDCLHNLLTGIALARRA